MLTAIERRDCRAANQKPGLVDPGVDRLGHGELAHEGRVGSGLVEASARKLSIPPPWVWYRPSWGVPVEPQAVMSMAASTAAANGLKRKCVMP
jgi:hypothetical protein